METKLGRKEFEAAAMVILGCQGFFLMSGILIYRFYSNKKEDVVLAFEDFKVKQVEDRDNLYISLKGSKD